MEFESVNSNINHNFEIITNLEDNQFVYIDDNLIKIDTSYFSSYLNNTNDYELGKLIRECLYFIVDDVPSNLDEIENSIKNLEKLLFGVEKLIHIYESNILSELVDEINDNLSRKKKIYIIEKENIKIKILQDEENIEENIEEIINEYNEIKNISLINRIKIIFKKIIYKIKYFLTEI